MKRVIADKSDIIFLVDTFYEKVKNDDLIGVFFNEIVQLDFEKHMPVMYQFWESVLLDKATYQRNPMVKHIALHQKKPMKTEHFERWLSLWEITLNENFEGDKAQTALKKATQIAGLIQFKINPKRLMDLS